MFALCFNPRSVTGKHSVLLICENIRSTKTKTIEICTVRLPFLINPASCFLIGVLYDFRRKVYDLNQLSGRFFFIF